MKKILLLLIATCSCALMGMDQKQIIPVTPPAFNQPPAYAPPVPSAPHASTFETVEIQKQESQNNKVTGPQSPTANPKEKATGYKNLNPLGKLCVPLLCIITGAVDTGTSPCSCLHATCDREDEDHRRHRKFTHYFCGCTRKLLHNSLNEDTVCGLNTNIPDNEKYVYEIRSGGERMIFDGSGW